MPDGPASSRRVTGRRVDLAVLGGYVLTAALFLGVPLLTQSGSSYVGAGYDPQIFIWSFAWWPHAILHGQNPFITHAIWAPDGLNLAWTTTVPGLALAFSPLTLIAGPIVSYDVAAILMPALAAWTAFLLCRYLTRVVWPSVVGGYLFGFSSYLLAQAGGAGHLHLSAVFLLPLVALVILRFLDEDRSGRWLVVRLGPMLALQVLIATEVAFTLTLAIVVALALAFLFVRSRRERIVALLPPLACAYLVAALVVSPLAYFVLTGFRSEGFNATDGFIGDLANFAIPTRISLLAGGWSNAISGRFPGNTGEQDAYLGLPTLLIIGLFAWSRLRTASGHFLLAALAAGVVVTLGATATVDGNRIVSLPWKLVHALPLFDNVLTSRLAVYVSLVAAVIVALWASGRRTGVLRWLLPVLAVLALAPDPRGGGFATRYGVPAIFTQSAYENCLDGQNILPFPSRRGSGLLWQAENGFRFTMAAGDISPLIPGLFQAPGAMEIVTDDRADQPGQVASLRTFIATEHVTTVVLDPKHDAGWAAGLDGIARPQPIGGVVLYHVAGPVSPCESS